MGYRTEVLPSRRARGRIDECDDAHDRRRRPRRPRDRHRHGGSARPALAMQLVDYTSADVQRLAISYASAVASTPHCDPVDGSAAQWQAELAALPQEATDAGTDECSHRRIILAESTPGGDLLGFVDVCVWPAHTATAWGPSSTGTRVDVAARGLIRFLWYERGERRVGEALIDAAEAHIDALGLREVTAFDQDFRYSFYMLSSAYYSQSNNHVVSLLQSRGYEQCSGECYYDWADFYIADDLAPLPDGLRFRIDELPGTGRLPGTAVYAIDVRSGQELGVCVTQSTAEYSCADAASERCFTTWIGVPISPTATRLHPSQGKGLGKCLLAESLRQMKRLGYKQATISTAVHNHRAQVFYSNFGYDFTGWTVGLERSLDDKMHDVADIPRIGDMKRPGSNAIGSKL